MPNILINKIIIIISIVNNPYKYVNIRECSNMIINYFFANINWPIINSFNYNEISPDYLDLYSIMNSSKIILS